MSKAGRDFLAIPFILHILSLNTTFTTTTHTHCHAPTHHRRDKDAIWEACKIVCIVDNTVFYLQVSSLIYPFSIGSNIKHLIDRPDETYCFRLQKDRVYYVRYELGRLGNSMGYSCGYSESMMRMATNIGRDHLGSLGVCFGKFTKTGKFTLHITALDHLAQYAKVKRKEGWYDVLVIAHIVLGNSTKSGSSLMVKCHSYTATM